MRPYDPMSRQLSSTSTTSGMWRNWARTVEARPARVEIPADQDAVAAVLTAAAREGRSVKPVGSGHSFTPVAATDGVQVRLDKFRGVRSLVVDPETGRARATVGAGTPLHVLNAELGRRGFGLTNMGDIAVQTVSGAVGTGTHGTGRNSAALATQVCALQIVLPNGSIVDASADHEPELFESARLGLGALGIVTELTFDVEPAFNLHAVVEAARLDDVLDRFHDLAATEDHVEFHWLPFTDTVQLKRNNRTAEPPRPLGRFRAWWEGEVIENVAIDLIQRMTRAAPRITPTVNLAAARLVSRRDYCDAAPSVFTSIRRVRFHEMEYALPREAALPALREFRELTSRGPWRIAFPVEVRLAPSDDVWLSTAHGRDTVYIATHAYPRTQYRDWFDAAERLWTSYEGRPHWGKLHSRNVDQLRPLYPRMADFLRTRDRVDPERLMANDYLRSILGP